MPAMPRRELSPNGGGRSRRDPWSLSEAKLELGTCAYHAVLAAYAPNIPHFEPRVDVFVTMFARHNTRNGDGLYRTTDSANLGGDITKPLLDYGLVRAGVLDDDDYRFVRRVILEVRHVDTLEAEGIELVVEEVA